MIRPTPADPPAPGRPDLGPPRAAAVDSLPFPARARAGRLPFVVVLIGTTVWIAVFGSLAVLRHTTLHSTSFDLAIYDQVIWNTAHGRWFAATVNPDVVSGSHLGDHLSLALAFFAPLYLAGGDVRWLIVAQSILLGGAAPLAYWLVRLRLNTAWGAALLGLALLLHPTITLVNFFDFHPDVLILPLLLLAFIFAHLERPLGVVIALGLIVLTKESSAMVVVGFGLYAALIWGRRWLGLGLMAGGLLWFVTASSLIIPAFGDGRYVHAQRYDLAGGPAALLLPALAPAKLQYLVALLLPNGFLALIAPGTLLVGLPVLAGNLLSQNVAQSLIGYQYSLPLVAVGFAAAVEGIRRITAWVAARRGPAAGRTATLALIGVVCTGSIASAALRNGIVHHAQIGDFRPDPAIPAFQAARRLIPDDASVTASQHLGPHLARREVLRCFPDPACRAGEVTTEYIIVERADAEATPEGRALEERLLDPASGYSVAYDEGGIILWRRR